MRTEISKEMGKFISYIEGMTVLDTKHIMEELERRVTSEQASNCCSDFARRRPCPPGTNRNGRLTKKSSGWGSPSC